MYNRTNVYTMFIRVFDTLNTITTYFITYGIVQNLAFYGLVWQ